MSFFVEWNDYLKVNVKRLDELNKQLTVHANETYKALLDQQNSTDFEERIIKKLLDYAKKIFILEEELMIKNGYNELKAHKEEHNNFSARLAEIVQNHKAGKPVSSEILDFLKEWLKKHILKKDKELGIFLNSRGIN